MLADANLIHVIMKCNLSYKWLIQKAEFPNFQQRLKRLWCIQLPQEILLVQLELKIISSSHFLVTFTFPSSRLNSRGGKYQTFTALSRRRDIS